MAIKENDDQFVWLTRTGVRRHLDRHYQLGCSIPFFLVILTIVALFAFGKPWIFLPIAVVLGVAIARYRTKIFYRDINCPKCSFNPTRRKSDGKPREDYHKVLSQLSRFDACPNCGDRGTELPDGRSPKRID